jgi:hypothetical protein
MLLGQSAPVAAAPYWWVPPLAVFLGVVVAIVAIHANRRVARMRATLDLIERTESSEYYLSIRKAFRILIDDPSPDTYLNHYELVAIGCEAGILDEQFYSYWMRTTLVRDWDQAKAFIQICRERPNRRNPAAFVHFERLAERFREEASLRSSAFRSPIHRFFEGYVWPSRT